MPSRRAAFFLPFLARPALAQSAAWPQRPVRIVVPFGTGGGTDITTRLIAPKLADILGQPVVLENRPGAGGVVGTDAVAKSAPDGSVFVLSTLSPIGLAVTTRGQDSRSAADFIARLRAEPDRFQYGSSGIGTSGHIACATFLIQAGARAVHVPYRGGGQVYAALSSGEIHFCADIPALLKPMQDAGNARALFVATEQRSNLLPETPTAAEAGLPDYKAYSWYGFFAPAGTPRAIVERMAEATEQALADPIVQARYNELGTPAMRGFTPDRFAAYVRDEVAYWVPRVRALGIRAE